MMKIILVILVISIFTEQGNSESCQDSRNLESDCGNYCFKVVRPVLDHTKALQSQVDEFINERKSLARLESTERLIEEQFNFHDKKMEQRLEDLKKSTGDTLQKKFDVLDKKLGDLAKMEQKLEDSLRSTENTLVKILEVLEKKMEDVDRILEVKTPNIGKLFQKIGSKYYYIEQSEYLNWFNAGHKCQTLGGHLVSFKNEVEFNAVKFKLQADRHYWIDISDLGTEGVFLSATTGLNATYYNWHTNNPDNWQKFEHCGELWFHDNKHLMNDANCIFKKFFICEPQNQ